MLFTQQIDWSEAGK